VWAGAGEVRGKVHHQTIPAVQSPSTHREYILIQVSGKDAGGLGSFKVMSWFKVRKYSGSLRIKFTS